MQRGVCAASLRKRNQNFNELLLLQCIRTNRLESPASDAFGSIVRVVKQRVKGVLTVEICIVQGSKEMTERLIKTTQNGIDMINTAFIERLNATFRQRLNSLLRCSRTLVRHPETLVAGMYIVGCFYNFCDEHHSLRLKFSVGFFDLRRIQLTPAMAAKLTEHQ
jgi:hypothetical protein